MCKELEQAIKLHEELGTEDKKATLMLFKSVYKILEKQNKKTDEYRKQQNARFVRLETGMADLKRMLEENLQDATKYRLIVEICKALFGTPQKTFVTIVVFSLIMGFTHLTELVELIKALI